MRRVVALPLCGAPFGRGWEGLLKWGAAQARVAYSDSKEEGAAQPLKEALPLAQQIHHIQHALCHIHQLQTLVHGRLAQLFVGGLFGQALALH